MKTFFRPAMVHADGVPSGTRQVSLITFTACPLWSHFLLCFGVWCPSICSTGIIKNCEVFELFALKEKLQIGARKMLYILEPVGRVPVHSQEGAEGVVMVNPWYVIFGWFNSM